MRNGYRPPPDLHPVNGWRGCIAASLLILAGCAGGGKKAAPVVVAPVAPPPVVAAPPPPVKVNPFKSERPGEMRGVKKVFIPQFRVEFVASQSGADNKAVVVGGLSTRNLQLLADKIYEDLVTQLRTAGLQIVPRATLGANETFQRLDKDNTPVRLDLSNRQSTQRGSALAFTPAGLPFLIMTGDPGASMTQAIKENGLEKQLSNLQKELGAAPILATVRVGFAGKDLEPRVWVTEEIKIYGPKVQCFKVGAKENCGNAQQARFWTPSRFNADDELAATREPASQQELRFLGAFSGMNTEKVTVAPPAYSEAVQTAISALHRSLLEKLTPNLK